MGIVGLVVASSVPAMSSYARQVRLKAATREVMGLLSLARSLAISSRQARTVLVDPQRQELLIEETLDQGEPRIVRLSSSVEVVIETQDQSQTTGVFRIVFQPSGALAGRSVQLLLSTGNRTQTITVTSPTGAIALR